MDQNIIYQDIGILNGLKANIDPKQALTKEEYVTEFHTRLREIGTALSVDVSRFLVPDDAVKAYPAQTRMGGGIIYRQYREVETAMLLTKLDGVLNYLNILLQQPRPRMGFEDTQE